jgi:hypothetical protein
MRGPKVMMAALLLVVAAGCGKDSGGRRAVSGSVTFQGQPLDHGAIQFLTSGAVPSAASGAVIRDGRFRIPAEHGLEPGAYRVLITSPVPLSEVPEGSMDTPLTHERIPPEYSSAERGQATVEVKAQRNNTFEFNIN